MRVVFSLFQKYIIDITVTLSTIIEYAIIVRLFWKKVNFIIKKIIFKVLNDNNEEVKLKEFSEDDIEDLEVNIEGTEDLGNTQSVADDSYISANDNNEVDADIDVEEDIDLDAFTLDGFHEELDLDDFVNDEH